jgi:hypothetical protein
MRFKIRLAVSIPSRVGDRSLLFPFDVGESGLFLLEGMADDSASHNE